MNDDETFGPEWKGRQIRTIGDFARTVFAIVERNDAAEAKGFWEAYVAHLREHGASEETRREPERVAASNIGWMAGEYAFGSPKVAQLFALFPQAAHPVFGTTPPADPAAAIQAGADASRENRA